MSVISTSKEKDSSFLDSYPKEHIFVSFEEFCAGTNYAKQYLTKEQKKELDRILMKELRPKHR